MDQPKRKHILDLHIGADSLEELQRALEQIQFELRDTGNHSVSGSPSWGGHWEHVVDAEQTGERYRNQLEAWLAARRTGQ